MAVKQNYLYSNNYLRTTCLIFLPASIGLLLMKWTQCLLFLCTLIQRYLMDLSTKYNKVFLILHNVAVVGVFGSRTLLPTCRGDKSVGEEKLAIIGCTGMAWMYWGGSKNCAGEICWDCGGGTWRGWCCCMCGWSCEGLSCWFTLGLFLNLYKKSNRTVTNKFSFLLHQNHTKRVYQERKSLTLSEL